VKAATVESAARIAVVDDDPLFAGYLATFLKSRGYQSFVYSNGPAFLKALPSTPTDAVLLDVLMPNMTGLEILRRLRTTHPDLPVIMVSGQQVPSTIVDAVRLGAIDYVVKADDSGGVHEAALEAAICRAVERTALTTEVARLSTQVAEPPDGSQPCWTSGPAMREVMLMIERVADSDVSVLISGESGVGKEVVARELHRRSSRRPKPFVKVNCAALPSELLESELFGHERGAFTGAQAARVGKFEFANEGTIFLDEIGEMPIGLQAKLLHVLQDAEFSRLGSNRQIGIDVRVLAATNRDLGDMLRAGRLREDLYYRLQVIEIRVPPLRDRREEIPALLEYFLRRYSERYGRPMPQPSPSLRDTLMQHFWPGNVRELENTVKRFVILRDESLVLSELGRERVGTAEPARVEFTPPSLEPMPMPAAAAMPADGSPPVSPVHPSSPPSPPAESSPPPPKLPAKTVRLPEVARAAAMTAEREAIQQALDQLRWNRRKAAQLLGVSYKTLLNKMKECGITAPGDGEPGGA
jgi:DNA-binding NtrC family response regulator